MAESSDIVERVSAAIRRVEDFPKPGVVFRDIGPLLLNIDLFHEMCAHVANQYRERGITKVAGCDARGFLIGPMIAKELGVGFLMLRKPGKLPGETVGVDYGTEYSTDRLEMQKDAAGEGDKVLIVDDLIATGGTLKASAQLIESVGGTVVDLWCIVELTFLGGREKLEDYPLSCLVAYGAED
eukprot:PLAT9190.3.p2 GENE.PLAT9190.3~~PLAT9190.3.p2  ORF type:complete len:183 (-),score=68.84 PLAT9190.3:207-755(-)